MSDELRAAFIRDANTSSGDGWSPFKRNGKLNLDVLQRPVVETVACTSSAATTLASAGRAA